MSGKKQNEKTRYCLPAIAPVCRNSLGSFAGQTHAVVVFWAFACMEKPLARLEDLLPCESRPRTAVLFSREWAAGQLKMPEAKRAILEAHQAAKETQNPVAAALCHAIGQGCASVHVETHGIGLPMYELTALVLEYGLDNCRAPVETRIREYEQTLLRLETQKITEPLAPFLQAVRPNREQLLYEKHPYGQRL